MEDINLVDTWPNRSSCPLTIPWPDQGNPGAIRNLTHASDWLDLIRRCDLHGPVPLVVSERFLLAQKLYAYGWFEYGFIKSGELAAVVALELALLDRYSSQLTDAQVKRRQEKKSTQATQKRRTPMFYELLRHLVDSAGLTDDALPSARLYGSPVVSRLYESEEERARRKRTLVGPPVTLVGIRNGLAHGDPYDSMPWGGLLELVRDLIGFAYQDIR